MHDFGVKGSCPAGQLPLADFQFFRVSLRGCKTFKPNEMTQEDVNNWFMYHEIHKLHRLGFKKARIARYLVLDPRTVKKYLEMSEESFENFLLQNQERSKKLAPYEVFVKERLNQYPDTSAAQIHDWLKEAYPDLPDVGERTVYNFVMYVRQKHNIPDVKVEREYFPIPELPYGQQAQVDFGEYNMRDVKGKRVKVRFFTIVLARSRMKYVYFRLEPFTGETTGIAHEKAFAFFGGIPGAIVYDLDRTMVVDENIGNIILTATFKQYVSARSFKMHFCRKADPESKGKVENVVQYVKKNFLYNRVFHDIENLNQEAINWLGRTANYLPHNVTKKPPMDEHNIEKQYLNPYTPISITNREKSLYYVRKDNTINYKSNFYTLPMGTYQGSDTRVIVHENADKTISIYTPEETFICSHPVSEEKGKTVRNNNHKRDTSKTINEMIDKTVAHFTDTDKALNYCRKIRKKLPRYIRDHLQVMLKCLDNVDKAAADKALNFCLKNKLFSGQEFEQVALVFDQDNDKPENDQQPPVKSFNQQNLDKAEETPEKSDPEDYENIINP